MTNDMTVGKPIKLVLLFALPMLIGNIFQQFYSMADMIIVGNYIDASALAAVGSTGAITFFVMGFIFGLSNGFGIIVAQKFGANDEEGVKKSVAMAIILSLFVGIVVTGVSVFFARDILEWMNTPQDIIDQSYSYLVVIFWGTLATVAYNLASSILRALGDSKTPLYFLIIASLVNIVLDIVFITVFNTGVEGAAYATVISQAFSFVLCFIYIKKKYPILHLSKEHFRIDQVLIKKMLSLGLPGAVSNSITAIGIMVLQTTINGFGTTIVAAYTAATRVEQVFTMPTLTLGMAMATFAGQNLGAGKIERVKECVRKAVKIVLVYCIIAGILLFLFGGLVTRLFVSAEEVEVIRYSKVYLNVVAGFCSFLGILFIHRSTLQGLGNGMIPMISGAIELVLRVFVALILARYFGFIGVSFAGVIAWIGADCLLVPVYHRQIKKLSKKFEDTPIVVETKIN